MYNKCSHVSDLPLYATGRMRSMSVALPGLPIHFVFILSSVLTSSSFDCNRDLTWKVELSCLHIKMLLIHLKDIIRNTFISIFIPKQSSTTSFLSNSEKTTPSLNVFAVTSFHSLDFSSGIPCTKTGTENNILNPYLSFKTTRVENLIHETNEQKCNLHFSSMICVLFLFRFDKNNFFFHFSKTCRNKIDTPLCPLKNQV